jgi:LPS sulfotransferase NodH
MNGQILSKGQIRRKRLRFDVKYFLSTQFGGYPFELKNKFNSIWDNRGEPVKKFVIFSSGRSGSTLLVELLNSNPAVHCDSEILKRKLFQPKSLINARANLSGAKIYGFKLLSYQLRDIQSRIKDKLVFIKDLQSEGFQLIHLRRENKFLQALSLMKAISQSKWHTTKTPNPSQKLEIDIQQLDKLLLNLYQLDLYEDYLMQAIPHLKISYENDLLDNKNHPRTIAKISEYLGINAVKPKSRLKKISSKAPSEMISNWDEVEYYLQHSHYEEFSKAVRMAY